MWIAMISVEGQKKYLGASADFEIAKARRRAAEIKYDYQPLEPQGDISLVPDYSPDDFRYVKASGLPKYVVPEGTCFALAFYHKGKKYRVASYDSVEEAVEAKAKVILDCDMEERGSHLQVGKPEVLEQLFEAREEESRQTAAWVREDAERRKRKRKEREEQKSKAFPIPTAATVATVTTPMDKGEEVPRCIYKRNRASGPEYSMTIIHKRDLVPRNFPIWLPPR
ncbi:hypothetical protein DFS34DRAFT_95797 [Phlyctochytrium arcticum]|nr:hypothetical protein DFS34DRAFT_95797 [Phlyctochytrium arcticum]